MDSEKKDKADWIVEQYAAGRMGPNTATRLLMLEFYKEQGMSEDELQALEMELERADGK